MIGVVLATDAAFLQYLYAIRDLPVTHFFIAVTELGGAYTIACISLSLFAWLLLSRKYADAIALSISVVGATGTILALKYLVQRARPDVLLQAYPEGPYHSFPSAHAGMSISLYGFIFIFLWRATSSYAHRALLSILPIIIVLVGFSRLYLGVHYLSDVIAGFLIGLLFVVVGDIARRYLLR
jgi:membrane-associated phospholipid phosphatase